MARRRPSYGARPTLRPTADRGSRPVRRRLVVEAPQKVLLTVAVLSVLLHVALGVTAYDRSLGRVDLDALQETRQPIRVRQASVDTAFDPLSRSGETLAEQADAGPSLEEVSDSLLAEADDPPASEAVEQDLGLREYDEPRPEPDVAELIDDVTDFELPADVWQAMSGEGPVDLAYRPDNEGEGDAAEPQSGDAGADSGGARAAQRLLADAEVLDVGPGSGGRTGGGQGDGDGSGTGLGLPESVGPGVESGGGMDDRLLDMPLVAPDIDFAGMALDATTRLHVPEHLDHDFDYYVTRFDGEADERGYFRVDMVPRRSLRRLETMPKDVIFLLDVSGSVSQRWANEIFEGVRSSLGMLNEGDRFNIVLFRDRPVFFSEQRVQPATQENLDRVGRFLSGARTGGTTDINTALSRLLVRDVEQDRVYNLILITDGDSTEGLTDTREMINLITRDNDLTASIYAVGITRHANRELLEFLTYRNKGFSVYQPHQRQVAGTIRDLMSRIRYPLIHDLRLHVAGASTDEVYPVHLPNVHQGERISVYGRYRSPEPFTMRVTGNNMGKPVDFTFARDLRLVPQADAQLRRSWAFWKLHHLYSEIIRQGEQPSLLQQIEDLRQRYDLRTIY